MIIFAVVIPSCKRPGNYYPTAFFATTITETHPEVFSKLRQSRCRSRYLSISFDLFDLEHADIANKIINLIIRDLGTKVFRRHIFDHVRLIENDRSVIRQHWAIITVTQSKVGKKQVVVDNYYVGFPRAVAHSRDEARIEVRALLSKASIRTSIDVPPEW